MRKARDLVLILGLVVLTFVLVPNAGMTGAMSSDSPQEVAMISEDGVVTDFSAIELVSADRLRENDTIFYIDETTRKVNFDGSENITACQWGVKAPMNAYTSGFL